MRTARLTGRTGRSEALGNAVGDLLLTPDLQACARESRSEIERQRLLLLHHAVQENAAASFVGDHVTTVVMLTPFATRPPTRPPCNGWVQRQNRPKSDDAGCSQAAQSVSHMSGSLHSAGRPCAFVAPSYALAKYS